MSSFYCYLCPKSFSTMLNIKTHLKQKHEVKEEIKLTIKCVKSRNCPNIYRSFKAMTNHVRRCRMNQNNEYEEDLLCFDDVGHDAAGNLTERIDLQEPDDEMVADAALNFDLPEESREVRQDQTVDPEDTTTEYAIYAAMKSMIDSILALLTKEQISKTLAKNIFNQIDMVFSLTNQLLDSFLKSNVESYEGSRAAELKNLFFENISNILYKYSSEYHIIKQLKQKPTYVEPVSKLIGNRKEMVYNKDLNRYEETTKLCEFFYVPLKKTLEALFNSDKFTSNFFNESHTCKEGIYEKFCCGNTYKANEFHQTNRKAIRVQLYYDDLNLAHYKNNATVKIGAVYFTIENVPGILNSHLDNIHLLALFHVIDLQNYGQSINTILYPIVEELRELEKNGITTKNGQVFGTLVSCSADNLALHTLCGMFESFRATFFCQHCKMNMNEISRTLSEDVQLLRTSEDLKLLFESNLDQTFEKVVDGIGMKRYSYLNYIKHFDIFSNISIDILHDLLEGNIPLNLRQFLQMAIELKKIDLKIINQKVFLFDYGVSNARNKPNDISLEEHMGNSASQKLVLFLHFPFIFHDLINDEDMRPYWEPISYLLCITKICLATVITEIDITVLEYCIENYLKTYIANYKCALIPKQHFLIHYPRVIKNMGPPVSMWTIRYEQLHQKFKRIYNSIHNSKNICKTLAERFQQERAVCSAQYDFEEWIISLRQPLEEQEILTLPPEFSSRLSFIKKTNIDVRQNVIFVTSTLDLNAHLAKVENLYLSKDNEIFITFRKYETQIFNFNYASYEIKLSDPGLYYIKVDDANIKTIYNPIKCGDKEFILLMKINS